MKIVPIKANMTELRTDGLIILFSYKTPVAYQTNGGFFRTKKKFSPTTSKHINQWLDGIKATEVDQEAIENLV